MMGIYSHQLRSSAASTTVTLNQTTFIFWAVLFLEMIGPWVSFASWVPFPSQWLPVCILKQLLGSHTLARCLGPGEWRLCKLLDCFHFLAVLLYVHPDLRSHTGTPQTQQPQVCWAKSETFAYGCKDPPRKKGIFHRNVYSQKRGGGGNGI